MFIKSIENLLKSQGISNYKVEDAVCEIFDMVAPKTPNIITLSDILNCKHGVTPIISLLDAQFFYELA